MPDPRTEYLERLEARSATLLNLEQRHRKIGNARLAIFAVAAVLGWFAFVQNAVSGISLLIPVAGFIALIVYHQRVFEAMRLVKRSIAFYEAGMARLEDRWQNAGETGDSFATPSHPYAGDLDLFGKASLFQLLSTARTRSGETTLARWLLEPAGIDEILARQAAVQELQPRLDLREDLSVLGENFRSGVHANALASWSLGPAIAFPRHARIVAAILSAIGLTLLAALFATNFVNPAVRIALVLAGIAEGLFVLPLRLRVLQAVTDAEHPAHDLALFSQVLRRLESEQFVSPLLRTLRASIDVEGRPASRRIARLNRIVELIDSRDNVFVRVFGPLLLWTTQLAFAVEHWRADSGRFVPAWLKAVGEIEALSALANYAWEHPADPFPVVDSVAPLFEGEGLGHPLLSEARSVRNDVRLDASMRLLVISGSNMSGKSTLLRTVGVNAVLALAGAPVRARRLRLSALSVGASIRVTDSLHEGSSRFYAEITRIRRIMDLSPPVLFLLDELLHGTNSHDRRIGAEAIVRGLIARGGIGFISTHDLALAYIAQTLGAQAANVHFQDHLEAGRISFDYLLRPGVVEKSNALELMRAVGLEV